MTISIETNEDMSLFYYIQDLFSDKPIITVVDEFPDQDLVIPSVAVDFDEMELIPGEMGNRDRIRLKTYSIDIFAVNKTQRQEMMYLVTNALESSIPVFDYSDGFPPGVTPIQVGCMECRDILASKIPVQVMVEDGKASKLYYRAVVTFQPYYNSL